MPQVASYRVTELKGKVKSRIDQSDPNPAHKLRHSLEELTIPEGEKLNPRFLKERLPSKSPHLQKSRTFDSISQLLKEEEHTDSSLDWTETLPRSATYEFLSCIEPLADSEPISTLSKSSNNTDSKKMSTVVDYSPSNGVKRKLYFDDGESNDHHQEGVETHSNYNDASIEPELSVSQHEMKGQNAFTINEEGASDSLASNCTNGQSGDLGIYDIEISNSVSETTVVLKHILALSGKNGSANSTSNSAVMPIIEESETEEEEEEEEQVYPKLELAPYTLAHPIPELMISDEDGSIVETITVGKNLCPIATSNTNTSTEEDIYAPDIIGTLGADVSDERTDKEDDVEPTTQL